LFSNDEVAAFIGKNFEPVWEMVREVPIIRIDFGSGNVLTRTLHGNILTSVCTADGQTLDALPGIYEPLTYIDQLDQFRLLHQTFNRQPIDSRSAWIRGYHETAVAAIKVNQPPQRFIETKLVVPVGKGKIERPTEVILAQLAQPQQPVAAPLPPRFVPEPVERVQIPKNKIEGPTESVVARGNHRPGNAPNPGPNRGADDLAAQELRLRVAEAAAEFATPKPPTTGDAAELARWVALAEDTKLNETTRRRQIHELLAKEGLVAPAKVLKPIYKDVLHADLDDPYLGLGPTLFENYPFAKEDAKP